MLVRREDGYEVDTAPDRLDVARVHHWLSTDAYWALGRSAATVATAVANSICYGVYAPDGQQVGFARAVTDGATFAWVCDVYIDRAVRGRGLGTWLARTVVADLTERGVPRLLLATADAHEIYRKAGFREIARPHFWMELDRRGPIAYPTRDVADT
jgi:GNAT superfamily N-acetyltransferase